MTATGFALYRFPHQQQVTRVCQTQGQPLELASCRDLNDRRGFVVAPFQVAPRHPILLIRPDQVQTFADASQCTLPEGWQMAPSEPAVCTGQTDAPPAPDSDRASYGRDFRCFHDQLRSDRFRKLVLSRCAEISAQCSPDVLVLFQSACRLYPRLFVALTYTPQSGLWLTATPEILLEGEAGRWRTIALAGTMRLEGAQLQGEGEEVCWSTKNIQEQRYVATYITECLEQVSADVTEEGPRTVRAANLVHLRSDFTFSLYNNVRVGDVLQLLHPTPAVCGLPKQQAFRFIVGHEHTPRLYYSGFQGPLGIEPAATHLYVSLRCMQITPRAFRLYAGGGLLKDSTEEQEWLETEAKLETMRQCIATRKT